MDADRLATIPPITDECLVCDHIQAHIDALQAENERLQDVIAKHNILEKLLGEAREHPQQIHSNVIWPQKHGGPDCIACRIDAALSRRDAD